MNKATKKKLLNLLQDISYGFDKYAAELEDEEDFYSPWSKLHKYISDLPEDEPKRKRNRT